MASWTGRLGLAAMVTVAAAATAATAATAAAAGLPSATAVVAATGQTAAAGGSASGSVVVWAAGRPASGSGTGTGAPRPPRPLPLPPTSTPLRTLAGRRVPLSWANPVNVSRYAVPHRQRRVVNGRAVRPGERDMGAGFLARFFVGTSDNMYCSGALVTYRSILTAAHCFRNLNTQIPLERFKDDTVRIGGVGMYDGFLVNVERVVLHPSYDWVTGDHDVAVMTIRNAPLPATFAAKGLIVARIGYRGRVRVGTRLTQSGWGRTNVNVTQVEGNGLKEMTLSPRLLRQTFAVNDLDDCKRKLLVEGGIVEKASASQFFCGSLNDTVASCRGDSGSPAFSKSVSRTGRTFFYVEGIVSFGYTPRPDHPRALDECLVSWPDFYTNVPSYYSWIRRELSYRYKRFGKPT